MKEKRRAIISSKMNSASAQGSELPEDFIRMVQDVFAANFDSGLKALGKIKAKPFFEAIGRVYPDEIVLAVSLGYEKDLAATTIYASCDFDPLASSPSAQELLAVEVDAIGGLFDLLLNSKAPQALEKLAGDTLSELDDVPFEWTAAEVEKRRVYLKVDKANLKLDRLADDWLSKNDPKHAEWEKEQEEAVKELFVTGPRKPKKDEVH